MILITKGNKNIVSNRIPIAENDIAFRFNAKLRTNFVVNSSNQISEYSDTEYSNIKLFQPILTNRPILQNNTVFFDGIDDNLTNTGVFSEDLIKEAWAVAQSDRAMFAAFDTLFTTRSSPQTLNMGMFGGNGGTNLYADLPTIARDVRVNNINTLSFLPMNQFKTIKIEADSSFTNMFISLDRAGGARWLGRISDIILFKRALVNEERFVLQNYLTRYHNL